MADFNQEEFNHFVLENNVVGFFENPIKLKSGRMSNWYVNWRTVTESVRLIDRITDYIISFAQDLELFPACFYGVPEGATKLGIITQYKWAKLDYADCPLPMGRGKPKDHGDPKDRYFIGAPQGDTIVLEDVTTTGESLTATLVNLSQLKNVEVIAAFGLTNREELDNNGESVKAAIESHFCPYYELSRATELLPLVYQEFKNKNPEKADALAQAIEEEFKMYGIKPLKLI